MAGKTEPQSEPLSEEELAVLIHGVKRCRELNIKAHGRSLFVTLQKGEGLRLLATIDHLRQENEALKEQYRQAAQSYAGICNTLDLSGKRHAVLEAENEALRQRAEAAERKRPWITSEDEDDS